MNNKLICPFCQQELRPVSNFDNQDKRCVWYCPNCATNKRLWVMANEQVWQELIRTRKALDAALDWLEQVATLAKCDDDLCREFTKRKLTEIKTALEQKDVK